MSTTVVAVDTDLAFVLQALLDGGELSMDFPKVARGAGISLAGNANRKFQQILKKHGYKYDKAGGGIVVLDVSVSAPTTPAKKIRGNGKSGSAKKPSAKKRKLDEENSTGEDGPNDGVTNGEKETPNSSGEENDVKDESA